MSMYSARRAALAFLLAVSAAVGIQANGEDFFAPAGNRPTDLVYVGHVRDKDTGKLIKDEISLAIYDRNSGMSFMFYNDAPGHYRSPDVGFSLKALGHAVDPTQIEIEVSAPGYASMMIKSVPRKTAGVVEVNVELKAAAKK